MEATVIICYNIKHSKMEISVRCLLLKSLITFNPFLYYFSHFILFIFLLKILSTQSNNAYFVQTNVPAIFKFSKKNLNFFKFLNGGWI